ncbi:hypothetical protein LINPERHAP2_LOCUS18978 [Linum perenne]
MWKPINHMHIIDLDKGCFMVKFSYEKDYFKALTGGPWMILDHYLVVHQWSPDFRVSDSLPAKMVVWICFPLMLVQYYHAQILTSLNNLIGRTVKIDFNTQNAERGKFARLAVEIDLNEPLTPTIDLDGCRQDVEYENLPADPSVRSSEPSPDSFGPWMVVTRKSRRPKKEIDSGKESIMMGKEETKSSGENNGKKAEINASEGRKGIPKKITAKIKAPPSSNARGSSSKYPSNGNKGKTAAGQPKKQISLGQPGPGNSPTGPATQPHTPGLNNPKDPPEMSTIPSPPSPPPHKSFFHLDSSRKISFLPQNPSLR